MAEHAGVSGERALVAKLTDRLLAEHPPASVDDAAFWGAQYDLGLAWVHFPPGYGGLGVARSLQEEVDLRLAAAGAPSNALRNFVGLGTAAPVIMGYGTEDQRRRLL